MLKDFILPNKDNQKKFVSALKSGTPIHIALNFASIDNYLYRDYQLITIMVKYLNKINYEKDILEDVIDSEEDIKTKYDNLTANIFSNNIELFVINSCKYYDYTYEKRDYKYLRSYVMKYTDPKNKSFIKSCNDVYHFMMECEEAMSEAIIFHLQNLRLSANDSKRNPKPSQWFLEHYIGTRSYFPSQTTNTLQIESKEEDKRNFQIEIIDNNTEEAQNRISQMEMRIAEENGELAKNQ